jgi:hypothetical protein
LLLLGFLASTVWGDPATPKTEPGKGPEKKADTATTKRKPRFTVGKETTYVSGPLTDDGYIDYATALNERLARGVTPDNNANVLIWKAIGPRPEGTALPAEYFRWLGIDEPPARGDYFVPMSQYMKDTLKIDVTTPVEVEAVFNELERCTQRSWTARQHPKIAGWLKANMKPIALVIEASKRARYFSPLTPNPTDKGPGALSTARFPSLQRSRELVIALTARAMLHVGECRPDDAWRDLLACHRLGRLVAQGGTLIDGLVGIAIESIAGEADLVFLETASPDAPRVMEYLGDLRKLPPMPSMADKVDLAERLIYLDSFVFVDRGFRKRTSVFPTSWLRTQTIDWGPALRNGNAWFDRLAAALAGKDPLTRRKRLAEIEKELRMHRIILVMLLGSKLVIDWDPALCIGNSWFIDWDLAVLINTGKVLGATVGNLLAAILVPAIAKAQTAADRGEQLQNNLYLAFALAAYRHDHGRYPEKMAALAPKYLPKIPQDMFSGKPLAYQPSEKGYLFYSVGVNGRDEQGRGYDDEPAGDDLAVRMPLPKPRK